MRTMIRLFLCVLLTITPVIAQQQSNPSPAETIQNVFDRAAHAVAVTNDACPSSECATATAAVNELLAAAQAKHKAHELVGAERDKFLGDLDKGLTKMLDAVTHEKMKQDGETAQKLPKCDKTGLGLDQCQLCDVVYKAGLALCATYSVTCPACVAACIIITTLAYTRCIRTYCV